jgi:cell division topological specificity factor
MSFFSFLSRKPTATVARDRLQILLAHERATLGGNADLVAVLQEEILAVIARHIAVERDKVQIKLDRGDSFSTLEIGVEIPPGMSERRAARANPTLRAS